MGYLPDNFTCDACAKQRMKDTNHWWMVGVKCEPGGNGSRTLSVSPWTLDVARKRDVLHACGEECVLLLVQRWLATGNFHSPSQRLMIRPRGSELEVSHLETTNTPGNNLISMARRTG
jgi:hypothetical protein